MSISTGKYDSIMALEVVENAQRIEQKVSSVQLVTEIEVAGAYFIMQGVSLRRDVDYRDRQDLCR